jgi:hypothetical protein
MARSVEILRRRLRETDDEDLAEALAEWVELWRIAVDHPLGAVPLRWLDLTQHLVSRAQGDSGGWSALRQLGDALLLQPYLLPWGGLLLLAALLWIWWVERPEPPRR